MDTADPDPAGFRHEAFVYRDDEQYLRGTAGYVREGLDAQEAVLVAAVGPRLGLLREEFGARAADVEFLDLARLGRNPGRILPMWQDWIERNAGNGRGLRGVCEPPMAGRGADELLECTLHEQLLNTAFERGPAWSLLCPYDAGRLAADVVEAARRTHPLVFGAGRPLPDAARRHSAADVDAADLETARAEAADLDAADIEAVFGSPLPEPDAADVVVSFDFDFGTLDRVRAAVRKFAPGLGFDAAGILDLALVASELAANSVRHGGGAGSFRLWRQGPRTVCEVRDRGLITDPLVGLRRPDFRKSTGGAGLWTVNQICDLVSIRSDAEHGTVVRAQFAVG
jgi:anti-sigma regulatory factor (Ser/Thr protein kinase)